VSAPNSRRSDLCWLATATADGSLGRLPSAWASRELLVLIGSRQDVPELLACCDMAVSPSRAEGFSNALLEYMAVGLPTVATQVGGNRESIQHQVNGLLVPPDHPDALGDVICAICWRILASRHSWQLPDESGCAPALVSHS
jgi:glycosyltransferase involved in cell wall biosynthesis